MFQTGDTVYCPSHSLKISKHLTVPYNSLSHVLNQTLDVITVFLLFI